MKKALIFSFITILLSACSNGTTKRVRATISDSTTEFIEADTQRSNLQCVIILQPYEDFSKNEVERLLPTLQKSFDKWLNGHWEFKIASPIHFPQNSYFKERNRYRVTPILNYESKQLTGNEVIIGLTHKDICTNVHGKKDYGIVGISRPLKQVSLISDKRLKNKSLMWKPILHEFIHTFYGAKHCPNDDPTCFMKDAKGHGNFEIQDKLCDSCKH